MSQRNHSSSNSHILHADLRVAGDDRNQCHNVLADIAIPTKNRHAEISKTISNMPLNHKTLLNIADQSPDAPIHSPSTIHCPDLTGLPAARNALLDCTSTPWVVFIDDDCDLAPDFIDRLEKVIQSDPEVIAWGPVVETRSPWLRRMHRLLQLGAFRDPRRLTWGPANLPTRALFGCCFAVRRDLACITRFDASRHGYALGEDLDFFLRLPGRKRFSKRLRCVHREESSGRADPHTRGQAKSAFLLWMARRHGRHNPATLIHLALALIAAVGAGARAHERASLRGLWRGLFDDPFKQVS